MTDTNTIKILCHIDDIAEETSRGFQIDDKSLFAVKKLGEVYVYVNRCPHLGINLEWQDNQFLDSEAALIQCSTHGALFLIDTGECVGGPCLGASLQAVPFDIIDDKIIVNMEKINALD